MALIWQEIEHETHELDVTNDPITIYALRNY